MAEAAKWYVVHTYSGYENTVKATIEKTVESRQLQDQILAISIPMETVTEITESGASKTYDRKVYPAAGAEERSDRCRLCYRGRHFYLAVRLRRTGSDHRSDQPL